MAKAYKRPVFSKKSPSYTSQQDYIAKLDDLMKKNRGYGTLQSYDAGSNVPFRVAGRKVADPYGVGSSASQELLAQASPQQTATQATQQQRQVQQLLAEYQPTQQQTNQFVGRANSGDAYQQDPAAFQEAIYNPMVVSQEDRERIYQSSGSSYGVMSMADGGVLYNDGLIRYQDGTVKEFGGSQAQPIQSMADGSVRYSDGTVRRPASQQEMNTQQTPSGRPTPIQSLEGGRVLYDDGVVREYIPQQGMTQNQPQAQPVGASDQYSSGVINFYDKFDQGHRFNAGRNDLVGECAWFSEQITTLPGGENWIIGNTIEQKRGMLENYRAGGLAFYPGEGEAQIGNSIVFDEGTRYGHVATISEVFLGADGQTYYRLTESNYADAKTVTHDRVVKANDPKIVGILDTVPRQGYQVKDYTEAPEIYGERELAITDNATVTGEQERPQGQMSRVDMEAQLPPVSSDQTGGKYPQSMTPAQLPGAVQQQQQQVSQNAYTPLPMRELGRSIDQNQQLNQLTGGLGVGASELLQGDVSGAGQELQQTAQAGTRAISPALTQAGRVLGETIEKPVDQLNPTGKFDLGITEGVFTPEAAAARYGTTLKYGSPEKQNTPFGKVRQSIGNLTETVGDYLGVPEGALSETIAGGPTRRSNVAYAKEFNAKEQQQPAQSLGISNKVSSAFDRVGNVAQNALQAAGEGVKTAASQGATNLANLATQGLEKIGLDRKVGEDGQQQAVTAAGESAGSFSANRPLNDARDPFFKLGGAETYKSFLTPNAENKLGGALSPSLFTDQFFKENPTGIAEVFGDTPMGQESIGKYQQSEKGKYPLMSTMGYGEYEGDGEYRKAVDEYNKQINDYNNSINSYIGSIPGIIKGVTGLTSMGEDTLDRGKKTFSGVIGGLLNRPGESEEADVAVGPQSPFSPVRPAAPSMSTPSFNYSRPSNQSSSASMSSSKPSAPNMSVNKPSASVSKPSASVSKPSASVNKPSVSVSKPSVTTTKVSSPAPKMSVAPKPAQNMSYAVPMSVAPKPASQSAKQSTVSKVVSAVTNVFKKLFR